MRPSRNSRAWLLAAGLGLTLAGCGGGSDPADQGPGPDPGVGLESADVNPVEPAPAAAPLPEPAPESAAGPAPVAQAAPAPASGTRAPASETDQLLALANTAPVAKAPKLPKDASKAAGPDNPGADVPPEEMMDDPGMQDPGAGPGLSIPEAGLNGPEGPVDDPGAVEEDGDSDDDGGGGGRTGPGSAEKPDYKSARSGANTFLDALDKKNTRVLAEAVAIRSVFEATSQSRKNLFSAIREENLPEDVLDNLAEAFEDMKVISQNRPKSTGSLGVIVGHMDKDKYQFQTRTIYMRHEKLGWKVQDFSGMRIQKMPNPKNSQMYKMRQKMQRARQNN